MEIIHCRFPRFGYFSLDNKAGFSAGVTHSDEAGKNLESRKTALNKLLVVFSFSSVFDEGVCNPNPGQSRQATISTCWGKSCKEVIHALGQLPSPRMTFKPVMEARGMLMRGLFARLQQNAPIVVIPPSLNVEVIDPCSQGCNGFLVTLAIVRMVIDSKFREKYRKNPSPGPYWKARPVRRSLGCWRL